MKNGRRADNEEHRTSVPSGAASRVAAGTERIKIEKEEQAVNTYYLAVSKWYKAAKFLFLAAFIAYLIVMMCLHRSAITYDNLMYLIRDFETDVDVSSKGFENISYNESEKMSFAIYKDRLGVATGTEFTLYNTTGSVELEYDHSMENPKVESGEKYALVYDVGGTSYSIYNTIARVNTKHTEYSIQGAHISDSGAFAMITRSKENRYLVSFYDSSFRELTRVYKDKYVTDVALDSTGKKYALISCNVSNSDFIAEIMTGSVNSDTAVTFELSGYLPLSVDWVSKDTFAIVCDRAVLFVDADGNVKATCPLSDMTLYTAHVYGGKVLVTGSENVVGNVSKSVVFDSEGAIVTKFTYNGKISNAVLSDNYIFCLSGEEIIRRDFNGNMQSASCPAYTRAIVPCFDNVAVCTGTTVTMGFTAGGSAEGTGGESQNGNSSKDTEDDGTVETVDVDLEAME